MFNIIKNSIEYNDLESMFDGEEFFRIKFSKPNRRRRADSQIRQIIEKGRAKKFCHSREDKNLL